MNNECIPFFEAAYTQKITVHAAYAVTGKTFVGPIVGMQGSAPGLAADPIVAGDGGNLLVPAAPAAGGAVAGVANWDAAANSKVPITRGSGTILPVTCSAGVAAGALLMVDAAGKVLTATTGKVAVGRAIQAQATVGGDVVVELFDADPADLAP
jgi:hypothetical protein